MHKANSITPKHPGSLLYASGDLLGGLDLVDLDVNHPDTDIETRVDLPEGGKIIIRTMGQLENKVIGLQVVQEADQAAPGPILDPLAAIISEAEMHGFFDALVYSFKHPVDRPGRQGAVIGVPGYIRLVDLQAGAGKSGNLPGEHLAQGHQQPLKITVVTIQEGASEHIGACHREFERSPRDRRRARTVSQQIEAALAKLAGETKLHALYLYDTSVTDAGVVGLETALPECVVVR